MSVHPVFETRLPTGLTLYHDLRSCVRRRQALHFFIRLPLGNGARAAKGTSAGRLLLSKQPGRSHRCSFTGRNSSIQAGPAGSGPLPLG